MRLNSLAITVLILLLAIIYMGLLERVLERMRLTGRQAMVILLAIIFGGSLPVLSVYRGLKINLGGMLVPLVVVIYLIATADERAEQARSFFTIFTTTVVVWIVDRLLPLEPGVFFPDIDPLYLPAVAAAAVAYGLGRSRRASFIGAFMGVLLIDLLAWFENILHGFADVAVVLGGGGVFGAALLSGILAVLLAEAVGEIRERFQRV